MESLYKAFIESFHGSFHYAFNIGIRYRNGIETVSKRYLEPVVILPIGVALLDSVPSDVLKMETNWPPF